MSLSVPKVSLLVLNWNGIAFTRICITSLLRTKYPNTEIIVVDNGSDTDEAGLLEKEFGKKIRIIRSPNNVGYAAGMNIAYRHARGEFVALLNNDMEFPSSWLTPLMKVLLTNPKVGACQPKIRDINNRAEFEYASAAGGFVDMFGYPFARGRIFSDIEKDRGQYDVKSKVAWAGIIVLRKKCIRHSLIFDPIYFNYGEDMDLCMKIYNEGYSIINVPESIVYHVGGGTLKRNLRKKMFYHHRNNLIFLLINWPWELLALITLPRILLDGVSACYYIANKFWDGAMAVPWAYASLISMLPEVLRHRGTTQKRFNKTHFQKMPIYYGSIVWDYYIRRKRTYSAIMKDADRYVFDQHENRV